MNPLVGNLGSNKKSSICFVFHHTQNQSQSRFRGKSKQWCICKDKLLRQQAEDGSHHPFGKQRPVFNTLSLKTVYQQMTNEPNEGTPESNPNRKCSACFGSDRIQSKWQLLQRQIQQNGAYANTTALNEAPDSKGITSPIWTSDIMFSCN